MSSEIGRDFATLLPVVEGTAVKGETHRTQACTEQAPQHLAFATHLRGARWLSRPSAAAQASFDNQRWPSTSSGATFFSDTRKVSLHAEITLRPGELLVATLASSVATACGSERDHITLAPIGMHYARRLGAQCALWRPAKPSFPISKRPRLQCFDCRLYQRTA